MGIIRKIWAILWPEPELSLGGVWLLIERARRDAEWSATPEAKSEWC